jgi:ABC-type multidrug transport system fused ATPase/permease subunit
VIDLAKKEATASGLFYAGTGLSGNLTAIAVLGLGGRMVMHGEITVGELTSFLLYTAYVGGSLMGMSSFYTELNKAIGASERVFDVLDSKPTIRFRPYALAKQHEPIQGAVTFKDVSFVYPTRADAVIFKGLSFSIQPGTVLGIAGTSGGGKSTITSLLLRYYDANTGHILIDNQDITSFNVHWWRQQVGVVSQEPVLFAGTIRENILYGRHTSTEEQVLQAVQNANCNFVHGFPQGLDTVVGERGHALSGGQKSRIAIARALLKDPRILILDEATSALDGASEHLVQDALDRLSKNRTVLTIAHRQSTLQKSELILCLDDGRVAEMGTFDALMRKRGVFYRLMAQQDLH